MNNILHIKTSLDTPELVENMVEKLAIRHADIGYGNATVPKYHNALETSSLESYVSGNIQLSFENEEKIKMPFTSAFLFTCIKEKRKEYRLNWSFSLS